MILHIWSRKYWQTPDVNIFNDSRLMLINWFWAINRAGCDQSRGNRDSFEHFRDLQWPSTLRPPANASLTITIFVSIDSRPVFLPARRLYLIFWRSDMSFGRSSWNINLATNHAYLTHIRLNGKFHGGYTKNNRKRATGPDALTQTLHWSLLWSQTAVESRVWSFFYRL